jgi:hypothetical protein
MFASRSFSLFVGIVMVALGAYIAVSALWRGASVTRQPLLDLGFALFFLLRGSPGGAARRPRGRAALTDRRATRCPASTTWLPGCRPSPPAS